MRPPESPKRAQNEAERPPKRFQNHLWIENDDFFKNRAPAIIKSSFLMVGGSVWELKIDPKRLRGEIKNDIEKKRQSKNKKNIKSDKNALGSNGPKDFRSSGAPREPP